MAAKRRKSRAKPKPMGAPAAYTKALATKILARLAGGESLRAICRDADMPSRETVRLWLHGERKAPADFAGRYALAQDEKADLYAEQVLVESRAAMQATSNHEVQARKLMADNLKWTAARMRPQRWGDKVEVGIGGVDGAPIAIQQDVTVDASELVSRDRLAKLAARIAEQPVEVDITPDDEETRH